MVFIILLKCMGFLVGCGISFIVFEVTGSLESFFFLKDLNIFML